MYEFLIASLLCALVFLQALVAEILEGLSVEDLGHDVSNVLLGWNMERLDELLVAECLGPLLAAVDVFQLGLLSVALREDNCSGIVDLEN